MNKLKKVALVLAIILAIVIGLTYTTFAVTGKITVETVRIRSQATTESKILSMGNIGENVEILGQEGDWYKVNYQGTEGYIYKDYIETSEEIPQNQQQEEQPEEEPKPQEPKPEESNEPVENPEPSTIPEPENQVSTELGDTLNKDCFAYLLPNYTSIKIVELKQNEQVKIITTLANWAKIESSEKEGWIPKTLLMKEVPTQETQPENAEPEAPSEVSEQAQNLNQAAYISSNASANLRKGPSTDTESIGKLARHTKITVISEENGWYKVQYNNKEGYVSKTLVTIGEPPAEDTTSSRSSTSRKDTVETTTPPAPAAPVSAGAASAASIAQNYIGCSYVYGGSSPSGFDCSGFTSYVYAQAGISLSRTSYSQASQGTAVSKSELQAGDLIVFKGSGHVGIYVGNGQFVHAANPKEGVRYDSITSGYWAGQYQSARRF